MGVSHMGVSGVSGLRAWKSAFPAFFALCLPHSPFFCLGPKNHPGNPESPGKAYCFLRYPRMCLSPSSETPFAALQINVLPNFRVNSLVRFASNWGSDFDPHPHTKNSLLKDFCLRPGLEWKFLLRRTWSGQKLRPLQFPGVSLPY